MAKAGRKPTKPPDNNSPSSSRGKGAAKRRRGDRGQGDGETVSGYFRRVFEERPDLVQSGSNQEIFDRWLADHAGEKDVPQRVKQILFNVKSLLRRKLRRKRRQVAAPARPTETAVRAGRPKAGRGLETLEEQIDEGLMMARGLDPEGLDHVIKLLRGARNQVVMLLGQ
jgi:hypothetical protein